MEEQPKGSRGKPPRRPPTAVGTNPEFPPAAPKHGPCRVISFAGPRDGVGKSTTCLNLALAWAGSQNRKVLILSLDPRGGNDLSAQIGTPASRIEVLISSLKQGARAGLRVLEQPIGLELQGAVSVSQWGVGLLSLSETRTGAQRIDPSDVARVLGVLSNRYDLFLDVGPFYGMQQFAYDLSDLVFWMCQPHKLQFDETFKEFSTIKRRLFPLERFDLVINQSNIKGGITQSAVRQICCELGKQPTAMLPQEDLIPEYANSGKILVVEALQSPWVGGLRPLLGRILEIKPRQKPWSSVSAKSWGDYL